MSSNAYNKFMSSYAVGGIKLPFLVPRGHFYYLRHQDTVGEQLMVTSQKNQCSVQHIKLIRQCSAAKQTATYPSYQIYEQL